jgi:3-dehydroquinate dehydratase
MQFASRRDLGVPLATMGIGQLGTVSRLLSVQYGSILAYTSVCEPRVAGQVSLKDFRNALRHIETDF